MRTLAQEFGVRRWPGKSLPQARYSRSASRILTEKGNRLQSHAASVASSEDGREHLDISARHRHLLSAHTSRNAATIDCKRGTAFQSTDADRPGILLPCRTCSTRSRRCTTICLAYEVTNRRAGNGCVVAPIRRVSFVLQALGRELCTVCQ
jgi:hypothetical protein